MFLNEFSPITAAQGFDQVRLAAAVRPDDAGQPGSILNSALSQKLLKPVRRKRSNFIVVTLRSGSAHLRALTSCWPRQIIFREAYAGLSGHRESRNRPRREENCAKPTGRHSVDAELSRGVVQDDRQSGTAGRYGPPRTRQIFYAASTSVITLFAIARVCRRYPSAARGLPPWRLP